MLNRAHENWLFEGSVSSFAERRSKGLMYIELSHVRQDLRSNLRVVLGPDMSVMLGGRPFECKFYAHADHYLDGPVGSRFADDDGRARRVRPEALR